MNLRTNTKPTYNFSINASNCTIRKQNRSKLSILREIAAGEFTVIEYPKYSCHLSFYNACQKKFARILVDDTYVWRCSIHFKALHAYGVDHCMITAEKKADTMFIHEFKNSSEKTKAQFDTLYAQYIKSKQK